MKNDINKLKLNEIIMKIATQFINIPYDQFSQKVQETLELIGTYLDVDRAYVFEYDLKKNIANNTYEWCHEGVEPQIDYLTNYPIDDMLNDWVAFHKRGLDVIYEDINLINHESYVYQTLAPQGIISICTIPLMIQGECFGFVGFDDIRQKRKWDKIELDLLRILGELIVNAIYKHKNDQLLVELKNLAQNASDAKGRFLAQMSHEIRTPLNGIYNAFYLLKKTDYTHEQEKYLDIAKSSLDILSSVINNILDITKIESGKMDIIKRPVDLENEIIKTIKILRPAIINKNLQCIFDFDYNINYKIICDIDKINQIILNIVNNAIKYTDCGQIKTHINIQDDKEGLFLSINVEDTGKGISIEEQEKLFDEFFQAKNRGNVQGTGLGLTIVNHLVHLMNGKLEVNSEIDRGSRFNVMIPVSKGETINFKQPDNQKVLLLSTDSSHQHIFKKMLESMYSDVDIDFIKSKNMYEIIVIDDSVIENENILSLIENHRQMDTKILLFTKNSHQSNIANYVFDVPVSRHAIIENLEESHDFYHIDNLDSMKTEGNILVVDDNEINLSAMMAILENKGLTCDGVQSGFDAIEMVKKHNYDMIMMDIQMPKMDGYEVSKMIRDIFEDKQHIPIVVVTANAFLSDYDMKMSSYIDDIIFKPLDIDKLEQVINKHLTNNSIYQIPGNLKIMNEAIFYDLFDLNYHSGIKMAHKFIDDYRNEIEKFNEVINTEKDDLIYKEFHYLKGPLSYLGAERVIYLINEFMKEKDISSVRFSEKIKQFKNELEKFIDNLRVFITRIS